MNDMINVDIDISALERRLNRAIEIDDKLKKYAHQRLIAYCEAYVPRETGTLSQNADNNTDHIEYVQPYAHYQYTGEIYGPNIPMRDANGTIVGWFSMPGQKKHPTGRSLTYSKEVNPLATDHWDRPAMAAHGDDLAQDIADYITRRDG